MFAIRKRVVGEHSNRHIRLKPRLTLDTQERKDRVAFTPQFHDVALQLASFAGNIDKLTFRVRKRQLLWGNHLLAAKDRPVKKVGKDLVATRKSAHDFVYMAHINSSIG